MKEALQLIAIRIGEGSTGGRKLSSEKPYYFLDGYDIIDDNHVNVSRERAKAVNIYDDYFHNEQQYPSVHISAIVGENGAGKSTVIEFMMRIINNFGAATLGEYSPNQRTNEHLHYIEGVNGSLYYRKDEKIWEIRVKNRNVQLIDYVYNNKESDGWYEFIYNGTTAYWDNEISDVLIDNKEQVPFEKWSDKEFTLEDIYKGLFYTYISNYSIYAYNTSDYWKESNNVTYERKCRRLGSSNKRLENDDCNWLHGLFHKNDGYQCPIVLSPYRFNGNIDINSENHLSKERLLALLVSSPNGFSVLNGHLRAVRFSMIKRKDVFDAVYLKRGRGEDRLYTKIDAKGWSKLRKRIPEMWSDVYGLNLEQYKEQRKHYEYALDYLTYKTLKISAQYPQYHQFHNKHKDVRNKIDETLLQKLIIRLSVDHSHITKKIRQILAYIVYGIYEQQGDGGFVVNIQDVALGPTADVIKAEFEKSGPVGPKRFVYSIDDLVPPPIYETDINLEDINSNKRKDVAFETLSSGEKQQVFTISSILYHLSNIESIFNDGNKERITYSHINVILEELELYFHPELQKNLVKYLLDGIRQMHFCKIKAINICLVTHSPFILSDIQSKNILALVKTGDTKGGLCTFGANIHDLLKTSFLHDSVIGDYAQWVINRIIILLQVYNYLKDGEWRHRLSSDYWFLKPYLQLEDEKRRGKGLSIRGELIEKDFPKEKIFASILTIDEPIIRTALLDEYKKVFGNISAVEEIAALNKRLEELKKQTAEA